jgi:aminomethyltransferase
MEHLETHLMKTPLHQAHVALGAKLVPFAGWEMPVYYQGIIQEHQAVRAYAGLFDVSHMGRILVEGKEAETFLDYLSTNKIIGKSSGLSTYTVLCREDGSCVDDVIIYKQDETHFFLVVNAGNRQKDLDHLLAYAPTFQVTVKDCFKQEGILALQGPQSVEILSSLFPSVKSLKNRCFITESFQGHPIVLSSTGYTGETGFELYVPSSVIVNLWTRLLECGKPLGLIPVGLGARDTLRLEMGYALYGHELSDEISPTETVAAWTIKWDRNFLGKEALERLRASNHMRVEYGVFLLDKGIAREGYDVVKDGRMIGYVTSGTFSPTLQKAIAIILVNEHLDAGDRVQVRVRDHLCQAEVVSLPFLKKGAS